MNLKNAALSALAVLAVSGCAALPLPADKLEHSESSIRGAEEVGANAVPNAKLHLQLAKDQTDTAKAMAARGDKRAVMVLARADADAELSIHLTREAQMHADALKAAEELKALKSRSTP